MTPEPERTAGIGTAEGRVQVDTCGTLVIADRHR